VGGQRHVRDDEGDARAGAGDERAEEARGAPQGLPPSGAGTVGAGERAEAASSSGR
jgi:hypothetical protein